MNDQKATLKILLFIALICVIIIVPFVVVSELNFKDKNFPEFQNINISQNKLEDETEYNNIKKQLQNDYYFTKLGIMVEYNSEQFKPINLEEMVWHFIFNYELENEQNFTNIDKDNQIYCLKKREFLKAFEELYDIDITENQNVLKGYYKYIYDKPEVYCIDAGNVAEEYDNDIKIGIERLAMIGTTITADINVYEYYASSSNSQYIKDLEFALNSNNFEGAKFTVEKELHGTVTKRQIKFKMNKHGDHFKYTVLSIKNINY